MDKQTDMIASVLSSINKDDLILLAGVLKGIEIGKNMGNGEKSA